MKQNKIVYPRILSERLEGLSSAPMTLLRAGLGFGKTTAVSNYIKNHLPKESSCHWYTCFEETPEQAWRGICHLISYADKETAGYLSKLDLPLPGLLGYVAQLMGDINCQKETFLVIDDYQQAKFPAPYKLLDALALHHCPKLHIVVLTQAVTDGKMLDVSNPRIHRITQSALCFCPEDIQRLFAEANAVITSEQANLLYEETGGWIAALQLQLSSFLVNGHMNEQMGMNELMERVFWRSLDEEQQKFGMMLSVLDTFTQNQAAVLLNCSQIPSHFWRLVYANSFIRERNGVYTMHSLLRNFWADKLEAQEEKFRYFVWNQAGKACRIQKRGVEAVIFFLRAEELAAAFEVPLTEMEMDVLLLHYRKEVSGWIEKVSEDVLAKNPEKLLAIGIKATLTQARTLVTLVTGRFQELLENSTLGYKKKTYIGAASELLASFREYNDVEKMLQHHEAAWKLAGMQIHHTTYPWTSCTPSVVCKFWSQEGALRETSRILSEGVHFYNDLTGGSGVGSGEAMQAEIAVLSGKVEEAEVLAYKGLYRAEKYGQDSLVFCVELTLCRIAVLRGNTAAFQRELAFIKQHAFSGRENHCVTSADVCKGFLFSMLEMNEEIPQWMCELSAIRQYLWPIATLFAQIIFARLLRKKEPARFQAIIEEFIKEAESLHILLPQIYYCLELAIWYEENGFRILARKHVEQAFNYGLADEVYLPFAECYKELEGVFADTELCCDAAVREQICRMGRKFMEGMAAVRAALLPGTCPLTPREREIALLAKTRLTNQEIAQKLMISSATVKNTLAKVYDKLNIHGKGELSSLEF